MKPVLRHQSQLLFRKSYKPNRVLRVRPGAKLNLAFRPSCWSSNPSLRINRKSRLLEAFYYWVLSRS
jgi:hypothetical protein